MNKVLILTTHTVKSDWFTKFYPKLHELLKKYGYSDKTLHANTRLEDFAAYNTIHEAIKSKKIPFCLVLDEYGISPFMFLTKYDHHYVALVEDEHSAYMTKLHNNANIVLFSTTYNSQAYLLVLLEAYLKSHFEGSRHLVRLKMLEDITKAGGGK